MFELADAIDGVNFTEAHKIIIFVFLFPILHFVTYWLVAYVFSLMYWFEWYEGRNLNIPSIIMKILFYPPPPQTLKNGDHFGFFNHTFYF